MKNILHNIKSLAIITALMISLFTVVNYVYLQKVSTTLDVISEQAMVASDAYHDMRAKLKSEQERISFLSYVLNIKNVLDTYDHSTKSYNTMDFAYLIAKESLRNNLDPLLVLAVIKTESSFRKGVVSHKGAIGLMQILPNTAHYVSDMVEHIDLESKKELFIPDKNITIGINYLAYLINKFNDKKYAIIAYNMGPSNLKKFLRNGKRLPERYYRNVMKNYLEITNLSGRV